MESGLEYIMVRQGPFASEHGSLLQIQGDVTTPTHVRLLFLTPPCPRISTRLSSIVAIFGAQ
jgi:hypothetical protein